MNEYTELVASISTKSDLSHFLSRLEETQRGLFRTGTDVDAFIAQQFSLPVSGALIAYAGQEKVNLGDPARATEFFSSLIGSLRNLPVVTLRLAFVPNRKQLGDFSRWFSENAGGHVVFEVVEDVSLIGGAVVEYEGRIGNYSLAKKLRGFFEQSKVVSV